MLELRDLEVGFQTRHGFLTALNGVHLVLPRGEVTGLVGESGSGKSVTALSIMRLPGSNAEIRGGQILLDGMNLLATSEREMERVRGAGIAVVMGGDGGPGADTVMYGEPPGGRVRSVFLRDPEGNYVQLDQRA